MTTYTGSSLPFLPQPKSIHPVETNLNSEILLVGPHDWFAGFSALSERFDALGHQTPMRMVEDLSAEPLASSLFPVLPDTPDQCFVAIQGDFNGETPAIKAIVIPGSSESAQRAMALVIQASLFLKQEVPLGDHCYRIEDTPRYALRGLHLDVSRHFFSREVILELLDHMALVGLNRFHWHLTDDQGWRVPIDGLEELTRKGAAGGLEYNQNSPIQPAGENPPVYAYDQKDLSAVLNRGGELGIQVVPEIDLPGHIQAAAAVLTGLACGHLSGQVPSGPWQGVGINPWAICPIQDESYQFIEKVVDQMARDFRTTRIHLGGDECLGLNWQNCPHCRDWAKAQGLPDFPMEFEDIHVWEHHPARRALYGEFISRIMKLAEEKGIQLELWDDVLEVIPNRNSPQDPKTTGATDLPGIQSIPPLLFCWHEDGVQKARGKGYPLVSCPETIVYFDHPQSPDPREPGPKHFNPNVSTLGDVLAWTPPEDVVGLQGCIWTEVIVEKSRLEYMIFPRVWGLAIQAWGEAQGEGHSAPQLAFWSDVYQNRGIGGNWDRKKW